MTHQRLPETLYTVYAELLDQAIRADATASLHGLPPGTFVSKTVGNRKDSRSGCDTEFVFDSQFIESPFVWLKCGIRIG